MLEHLDNEIQLMMQKEMLSATMLNSFANFREHAFDVDMHVVLCSVHLFLGLDQNLADKLLVRDDSRDHALGLLVTL